MLVQVMNNNYFSTDLYEKQWAGSEPLSLDDVFVPVRASRQRLPERETMKIRLGRHVVNHWAAVDPCQFLDSERTSVCREKEAPGT